MLLRRKSLAFVAPSCKKYLIFMLLKVRKWTVISPTKHYQNSLKRALLQRKKLHWPRLIWPTRYLLEQFVRPNLRDLCYHKKTCTLEIISDNTHYTYIAVAAYVPFNSGTDHGIIHCAVAGLPVLHVRLIAGFAIDQRKHYLHQLVWSSFGAC